MQFKKIKDPKQARRLRVKRGIRKKVQGTAERPRLSVFRSNTSIYAQLIDDTKGLTLASSSSRIKAVNDLKATKTEKSVQVGKTIAEKAISLGITEVVFDRNGFKYHGRVKSLAEGAREGGLKF
ncbi:MAG: 50S ribosomal protein L18 [Bacteroidetes bacterium]|nr:50S ribosomal protein L18 [Bacteroidota bacterium]